MRDLHIIRKQSAIDVERSKYIPEGRFMRDTASGLKNDIFPDQRLHINSIRFGRYYRVSRNQPSLTILTNWILMRNKIHYNKNRPFSVKEIATIQSFDNDYYFISSSINAMYKMIGNAVPPLLAKAIAEEIKNQKEAYINV